MQRLGFCTAGQNEAGDWFIACGATPRHSVAMLFQTAHTRQMSTADQHYDLAALFIKENGGLFWKTNIPDEYRTIAGIPSAPRVVNYHTAVERSYAS